MTERFKTLKLLRLHPQTTADLRLANISNPPARVFELRARGYTIDSVRVSCTAESGQPGRRSLYTLRGEPQ